MKKTRATSECPVRRGGLGERACARRRARSVAGAGNGAADHGGDPAVRGRSAVAEADPERRAARHVDRRLGRRPGQYLDHPSQQRDAAQQRERRRAQSAGFDLLPRRQARPRLQSGRRPRPGMGRARARLRVAGRDARHLCRPQGFCLARRQRREGCPHPQVHQGRQVRHAVRASGQERRQQRSGEFRPRRPD